MTLPAYNDSISGQKQPGRNHFYRLRTEGKNCLVFNPSTRQEQYDKGTAFVSKQKSTPDVGYFVLNLQECYQRDVLSYFRGIKLDRKNRFITIQDEFDAKIPSTVYWSMHTKADISISQDGTSAILEQNGKKVKLQIVEAKGAVFQILPATYLPGEIFPFTKNSENAGFRKIVIKLDKVKSESLRVDFIPLDNKNEPMQELVGLDNW
jgi:hypothetical protein